MMRRNSGAWPHYGTVFVHCNGNECTVMVRRGGRISAGFCGGAVRDSPTGQESGSKAALFATLRLNIKTLRESEYVESETV